ncbi:MAG: hypothetical protein M0T84_09810 [Betaproteobacteria bacterium]|nr:hypothetical protein [Betaproteobacteria bacterium]
MSTFGYAVFPLAVVAMLWHGPCAAAACLRGHCVPPPSVKPGDTWTYHRLDGWTRNLKEVYTERVTVVSPRRVTARVTISGTGRSVVLAMTDDLGLVAEGALRFAPFWRLFPFPLTTGKAWRQDATLTDRGDPHVSLSMKTRGFVAGWETISVPAGSFRALRIETATAFLPQDPVEHIAVLFERRTVWYVPRIKQAVKVVTEDLLYGTPYSKKIDVLTAYRVH